MHSTKRLLVSATGILLSASPAVAITQSHGFQTTSSKTNVDPAKAKKQANARSVTTRKTAAAQKVAVAPGVVTKATKTITLPALPPPPPVPARTTAATLPPPRTTVAPTRTTRPPVPTTAHSSTTADDDQWDDGDDSDDRCEDHRSACTTTTTAPGSTTTTVKSTTTTTVPKTTTTVAPTTTTVPKTTTTVAPTTTTTVPKTTTTVAATTTTTAAPAPTTTTTVAPTTTTTTTLPPPPPAKPLEIKTLNDSSAQTVVPPGVIGDPNRGFAVQATVRNITAASQTISVTITGAAASKFAPYLEAKDYGGATLADGTVTTKVFRCAADPNTDNGVYYGNNAVDLALLGAPSFTCTGILPAGKASVITISSGSKIGSNGTSSPGGAWSLNVDTMEGLTKLSGVAASGTFK